MPVWPDVSTPAPPFPYEPDVDAAALRPWWTAIGDARRESGPADSRRSGPLAAFTQKVGDVVGDVVEDIRGGDSEEEEGEGSSS